MKYFFVQVFFLILLTFAGCGRNVRPHDAKLSALPTDKVLLVLAHPDDETMIGSFLVYLREQQVPVRVIYATNGSGGRHFSKSGLTSDEMGKIRELELEQSGQCYGFQAKTIAGLKDAPFRNAQGIPMRDGRAFLSIGAWDADVLNKAIAKVVEEFKPNILITMSLDQDTHAHHKAVRFVTQDLLQEKKLKSVKYAFAIKEWWWVPGSLQDEKLVAWLELSTSTASNSGQPLAVQAFDCAKFHQSQTAGHTGPLFGQEKISLFYHASSIPHELFGLTMNQTN